MKDNESRSNITIKSSNSCWAGVRGAIRSTGVRNTSHGDGGMSLPRSLRNLVPSLVYVSLQHTVKAAADDVGRCLATIIKTSDGSQIQFLDLRYSGIGSRPRFDGHVVPQFWESGSRVLNTKRQPSVGLDNEARKDFAVTVTERAKSEETA